MRIDKYLWCIRYYKTRSLAAAAVKKGQVRINDRAVKPSQEVYPQDKVAVRKNQLVYQLTVLDLPRSRVGAKLVDVYRKDTTPKETLADKELRLLAKDPHRKKGLGRPTKKERRALDDYLNEEE